MNLYKTLYTNHTLRSTWHQINKRERIGFILVLSVLTLCLLNTAGWLFDIPLFQNFLWKGIAMRQVTAYCFILVVIALLILETRKPVKLWKFIVFLIGTIVISIGLLSIVAYILEVKGSANPFNIWFFNSFLSHEDRMALVTAILFIAFSSVLFLLTSKNNKHQGTAHALTLAIFITAYSVPVSYFIGITSMYSIRYTSVSLYSGLSFCLLCTAVLLFYPKTWFMKVFANKLTGGYLARKLIPGIFLVPLVVGWLRINGERAGWFSSDLAFVFVTITYTSCFLLLLWLAAKPLVEIEKKQRLLDESLRQSEEQYRQLVESANSMIMRLDTNGTLKFVNEHTLRFFEYTREEMIGKNVMMILPAIESTGRDLSSYASDVLKNPQKNPQTENENIKKNGERVWVSWTNRIITDKDGNPEILTIGNDITERKKIEQRLAYERELFEGIIDNIPVMITIYDPALKDFKLNKALQKTIGWTDEDAADGNLLAKVYPEENYRSAVVDYMQSLQPGWKEWVMTSKNGTLVDSSWANINLPNGVQIGIGIDIRESKRAEATLRENEQRLQIMFNNAAIGIVVTDSEDRFIEVNNRLCEILGYSREELLGKTVSDITAPEDRSLSDLMNSQLHRGEFKSFEYEKRYLKAYGAPIWVHVTVSVILDSQGKHINSIGTVEDISERKRAEEAVRLSEERLKALFENLTEGLITVDPEKRELTWNSAALKMHGYKELESKLDFLTRELDNFEPITLNNTFLPFEQWPINRMMRGETFQDYPLYVKNKQQGWKKLISYSGKLIYDNTGKPFMGFLSLRDITEMKKAEEALRESEEMFSTMVQVIPIGILLTNGSDQRIFKVNPAYLKITGFSNEEEVIGKTSAELGIVRDVDRQKRYLEEFKNAGKVRDFEFETFTTSGNQKTVSVNMVPVSIGDKGYFLTSIADITVQKAMERELRHQNEELTRFIYTVSHDLKSPLVTIKSFTSFLKEDIRAQDTKAQEKDLMYITNAADKMGNLLNELLELSRIGRKENPKMEVPMKLVAQQAIDLVAGRITQRNVKIILSGPDVILYGHNQRFLQLYQNLIDNAVKFMGKQSQPFIEIGSYFDNNTNQIVLFVRDNGSGIDPKYHHKVFGLFEKLDNNTEGTGIGLALIKRIVEVHNGSIWFTSDGIDKGTTFFFTLAKTS